MANPFVHIELHTKDVEKSKMFHMFGWEVKMRKVQAIVIVAGLLLSLTAGAEDKQTRKVMNKIEPLPRDLEIQLGLSALPPHLKDNASEHSHSRPLLSGALIF